MASRQVHSWCRENPEGSRMPSAGERIGCKDKFAGSSLRATDAGAVPNQQRERPGTLHSTKRQPQQQVLSRRSSALGASGALGIAKRYGGTILLAIRIPPGPPALAGIEHTSVGGTAAASRDAPRPAIESCNSW